MEIITRQHEVVYKKILKFLYVFCSFKASKIYKVRRTMLNITLFPSFYFFLSHLNS